MCLCMCMCTYMYIYIYMCVCICVFYVIICKGICINEGVCTGIWYLYVSIYVYTCMSMSMSMSMSMYCTCIYTFTIGNRWKGPVGGSPTIPIHSPTIGYDSPTITTSGSWVEGEPGFWSKKIPLHKTQPIWTTKTDPLTALTVDPFGNKAVDMSFFGARSQGDDGCVKGGNGDALAANIVEVWSSWKKATVLQCGDWNLIPFFSCLICGIFLVFNSLPWNQQVAPNVDDFEDDHSLPPQFAGGFSLFVSGRQLPNNSTLMDFLIDFLRLKLELFWSQLSFGVCWRDVGNAWWFQGPQDVYGHMVLPTLKMMKLWAQTLKGWKPIEHQALKSWVCFHCGYRMPLVINLPSPYVHSC